MANKTGKPAGVVPTKLGRNPLESLQTMMDKPLGPATHSVLYGSDFKKKSPLSYPLVAHSLAHSVTTSLGKVKEMQIEVDWKEFYRSTLGLQVKKISRIFSIS